VASLLPAVPLSPPLAPRRPRPGPDRRVALTLATTLAVFGGMYVVYTYIGVTFQRATGGDSATLARPLFV